MKDFKKSLLMQKGICDTFGNKVKRFGYKLHLAVDTKSELPIAHKSYASPCE
jgi:hypothetical protein